MRHRLWLAALVAAMAVTACAPSTLTSDPSSALSGSSPVRAGVAAESPAPDFTLKMLGGGEASLSDYRGRPVFINFWASWCAPCRAEMPDIVEAYNRHRDAGLEILAINNTQLDVVEDVHAFVKEFQMPFPVLLDEQGAAAQAFGILGLPTSVFVDGDGVVRGVNAGPLTEDTLEEYLAEILP